MARTRTHTGGDDPLFVLLHQDHEEVAELFRQILAGPDKDEVVDLWRQLSLSLTAHSRAEAETVYQPLAQLRDLGQLVSRAIEEHNRADKLLAEADALVPGTDEFFALVTSLEGAIREHVKEEEDEILPRAAQAFDAGRREEIVRRFRQRKQEILPEVEQELEPVFEEEREEVRAGEGLEAEEAGEGEELLQVDPARGRRKAGTAEAADLEDDRELLAEAQDQAVEPARSGRKGAPQPAARTSKGTGGGSDK